MYLVSDFSPWTKTFEVSPSCIHTTCLTYNLPVITKCLPSSDVTNQHFLITSKTTIFMITVAPVPGGIDIHMPITRVVRDACLV